MSDADGNEDVAHLFGSDSEDSQPRSPGGSDNLLDEEDTAPAVFKRTIRDSPDEDEGLGARDSDDERPVKPSAPPMEIEAPLLPLPPKDKVHLLKLTNIVGIQPKPFDPDTFQKEEEMYYDDDGKQRIRLRDHNVIRWRYHRLPGGREVKESNARYVQWSDGSWQLLLGDEVLDITKQDISRNNTYLFAVRNIIQGQCQLTSRMVLRPASLDSKLHMRLREAVDKRHTKVYRVQKHSAIADPEKAKAEEEKKVEAIIKGRENLLHRQNKEAFKYSQPPKRKAIEKYLESDDEEDLGYNDVPEPRRATLSRGRNFDDDEEIENARRLQSAKRHAAPSSTPNKRRRVADDDSDEEEEEEYVDEDEEEEEEEHEEEDLDEDEEPRKGKDKAKEKPREKPKSRPRVVLSDDDDDE